MKNSKGYVSILLISLVPFLIALLFGTMLFFTILLIKSKTQMSCRTMQLNFQNKTANIIKQIQILNPQISALRIEMISAKLALAAAIAAENPPAIARAQQWIQRIRSQQKILALRQKQLFYEYETQRIISLYEIPTKIKNEINDFSKKLNFFVIIKSISGYTYIPELALDPDTKSENPPLYLLKRDFINKQTSHGSWIWKVSILNNKHWLSNFVKGNTIWTETCHASLKESLESTLIR